MGSVTDETISIHFLLHLSDKFDDVRRVHNRSSNEVDKQSNRFLAVRGLFSPTILSIIAAAVYLPVTPALM